MEAVDEAVALMSKVDGWLRPDEARLLFESTVAAVREHPGAIVEIGSYRGRSTVLLACAARTLGGGRVVHAIDPHEGIVSPIAKAPPTWNTFMANVKAAGVWNYVDPICKKAEDVDWKSPIAVLYIDGLHDYAHVSADHRKFSSFVPSGGSILFHDYGSDLYPDVARLVEEMVSARRLEILRVRSEMVLTRKT